MLVGAGSFLQGIRAGCVLGYDEKSCNALEKPYYTPIEAALRWCNLIQHEAEIFNETNNVGVPKAGILPQWPCLRANAEKIYDALANGDMPFGRDGRNVLKDDYVAYDRRTVRHTDLKAWMAKNYPDQKPKFLFDEIERTTHTAINADSFLALQADRDALKTRVDNGLNWAKEARQELTTTKQELEKLRAVTSELTTTERDTLLVIIAALCKGIKQEHHAKGAAGFIVKLTQDLGAPVSENTISTALKKIPEALERRGK